MISKTEKKDFFQSMNLHEPFMYKYYLLFSRIKIKIQLVYNSPSILKKKKKLPS